MPPVLLPELVSGACLLADPSFFIDHGNATPETLLGVELESVKCLMQSFEEDVAHLEAEAVPGLSLQQELPWVNTSSLVVAPWRYQASNGMRMRLRAEPSIDGLVTDEFLEFGEVFIVTEEATHSGEPGVRFLRLANGRGWAFDVVPDKGVMCVRVEGGDGGHGAKPPARPLGDAYSASCADHPVCASSGLQGLCCPTSSGFRIGCCAPFVARKLAEPSQWRYNPPNQLSLRLRKEPALDAELSDEELAPHEVFRVSEELPMQVPKDYLDPDDEGSVLFLRLYDGRGWAFDRRPGLGVMCMPVSDASSRASNSACEAHAACRGLMGQCCPTKEGLMLGCCR